jgi:hypothetical protein
MFDWNRSCSYDEQQKRRFHTTARSRLKKLAAELALPPGSYGLRSNKAGIAVPAKSPCTITAPTSRSASSVCPRVTVS